MIASILIALFAILFAVVIVLIVACYPHSFNWLWGPPSAMLFHLIATRSIAIDALGLPSVPSWLMTALSLVTMIALMWWVSRWQATAEFRKRAERRIKRRRLYDSGVVVHFAE